MVCSSWAEDGNIISVALVQDEFHLRLDGGHRCIMMQYCPRDSQCFAGNKEKSQSR